MKESYTSINVLIDRVLRHPLMSNIPKETIVDHTIDFMRIVGASFLFEEKVSVFKLDNYRVVLPCDLVKVNSVRGAKDKANYDYSTSSYHLSNHKEGIREYKIQGNILYSSKKDEEIEVSYSAIKTDEEGLPLIPDNSSFLRAAEAYIKVKWFTVLLDLQQISTASLQVAQQDYAWAVGHCQSEFVRMNIDQLDTLYKRWSSYTVNRVKK